MKEKVKITVGDIIITWHLKLFCNAKFLQKYMSYYSILENMFSKVFGGDI